MFLVSLEWRNSQKTVEEKLLKLVGLLFMHIKNAVNFLISGIIYVLFLLIKVDFFCCTMSLRMQLSDFPHRKTKYCLNPEITRFFILG